MLISESQRYYEVMETKGWAHPDSDFCLCGGRGWVLSEVDTWHKCPFHSDGKGHPEEGGEEEGAVLMAAVLPEPAKTAAYSADDVPF